jgi:hypothetical protein
MKRCFLQRMVQCADADDAAHRAAAPRLVRRALVDASPGTAPAQRWSKLQQRIHADQTPQSTAHVRAHDVAMYYCLFVRVRYSLALPIA